MRLGIVGANGFIGKEFKKQLPSATVIHKHENPTERFDIVIDCSGSSKKFWANTHPREAFNRNVNNLYDNLLRIQTRKYILISSIESYSRPYSPYSLQKTIMEEIVFRMVPNHMFVRPGLVIGNEMKKGIVFDILNDNPIFLTSDSELSIITVEDLVSLTTLFLESNVTHINIQPKTITISEIAKICDKTVRYHLDLRTEKYETEQSFEIPNSEYFLRKFLDERMVESV